MKKVLVTGGSGFIGSHTVEELINKEYEVIVLDNFSTGRKENIAHLSVPCIEEDVTKPEVVEIIKKNRTRLYHSSCCTSKCRSIGQ